MKKLAAILLMFGMVTQAKAWGPEGHVIVAMVAEARLSDGAKSAAREILFGVPLVTGAVFADEHRVSHTETSRWHYVDIPYDKDSYDPQRDCAVEIEGDCIIEAISRELARIRDPEARVFDRADALKRLIHWVGDIHQPFHTIERDGDQGGNKVTVTFFGEARKNLHGVWDSGLISQTGLSVEDYTNHLLTDVVPGIESMATTSMSPVDWALESHSAARSAYVDKGADLGQEYFDAQRGTMDRQLARAGIRLAALIEKAIEVDRIVVPKALIMPGARGLADPNAAYSDPIDKCMAGKVC